MYSHFSLKSNIQSFLQLCAGGLFVLVESVGINIQRGGGLAVAEDARHCGDIRTARDHQAGGGVPEGMDVRLLRQAVLLEDQLEAVGKGGGRHGELRTPLPHRRKRQRVLSARGRGHVPGRGRPVSRRGHRHTFRTHPKGAAFQPRAVD